MEWPSGVEPLRRPTAHVSSDLIIYRLRRERGCQVVEVLYGERQNHPWKGYLTIPFGGYVDPSDKDLLTASKREVEEETGLKCRIRIFVGSYGPERFHHKWVDHGAMWTTKPAHVRPVVANVFAAQRIGGQLKDTAEQRGLAWVRPELLAFENLAFDHAQALADFLLILKTYDAENERRLLARFSHPLRRSSRMPE